MLRAVLLVLCLVGLAGAWMPNVGEYVSVTQSIGILERQTFGTVLEIDATFGTIMLERDHVMQHSGFMNWTSINMTPEPVVIGIPTIVSLKLVDPW